MREDNLSFVKKIWTKIYKRNPWWIKEKQREILERNFNLLSVLDDLTADLKQKTQEVGLKHAIYIDETLPGWIWGNPVLIQDIVHELVNVSIRKAKAGTVTFAIRGEWTELGYFLLKLSVADAGEGFYEEELQAFFEHPEEMAADDPVYSSLQKVKRRAEVLGGRLTIYTVHGSGALYCVDIPQKVVNRKSVSAEAEVEKNREDNSEIAEGTEEQAWIDVEIAMNYCGGEEEMRQEMLGIFYEQAQKYLQELPELYKAEDWEHYRIVVHAMKGNSLGIGAKGFSDEALEQENAARDGDIQKIKETWETFFAHFQSLIQEVCSSWEGFSEKKEETEATKIEPERSEEKQEEKLEEKPEEKLEEKLEEKSIEAGWGPVTEYAKALILVVDDDEGNLSLARKMLGGDYQIATAKSGAEALEYLEHNIPDLMLLDVQMPEMSGFEVIQKLFSDARWEKIPVIFLTADRSPETEESCFELGAMDYIAKPFVPKVVFQRIQHSLQLSNYQKNLETMVEQQLQRISQMEQEIIITMANLIESRDGTTGEHVKRTSAYVRILVKKMREKKMYPEIVTSIFAEYVTKAAPMHDIGKITISDRILQKPGNLTDEEFRIMQNHTVEGGRLIRENMMRIAEKRFVEVAYEMAKFHHEKWNGGGYPSGLKGEEIPLSARIMAVADTFDALVSKRQYKEAIPFEEALAIMEGARGVHFQPEILDTFLDCEEELRSFMKEEAAFSLEEEHE